MQRRSGISVEDGVEGAMGGLESLRVARVFER